MKNYRKYFVGAVLVILLFAAVSQLDIKSVKQYEQEQEQLADSTLEAESTPDTEKTDEARETASADITEDEKKGQATKAPDEKKASKKSSKNSEKKQTDSQKEQTEKQTDSPAQKKQKKQKTTSKKTEKKQKKKSVQTSEKKKTTDDTATENPQTEQQTQEKDSYIECLITIDCSILLENMDKLAQNVRKYVPESGMFLEKATVKVKDGASAYDVLVAACKAEKIAYDAEYSKMYQGSYVKGIGYLYEKMAGNMSGWLYQVDGTLPNVGAAHYIVKEGECVEWIYTCSGRVGS